MPQLLVRDVLRDVVEAFRRRALRHGRGAVAEHRVILDAALKAGSEAFRARAEALRSQARGRILGDSADLIREDRDSR